jgi:hypothetical protein
MFLNVKENCSFCTTKICWSFSVEPYAILCLVLDEMMPEWQIRARAHRCAKSEEPFSDGAIIYTLLYRDRNGFRREDLSEQAWLEIKDKVEPFSFWKSRYEAPPPPARQPVKESGEALLRKLLHEDRPEHMNARYVLSIMLERKKTLKQVDVRETEGAKYLIYEHSRTGEAFIIEDPRLKLDQLDSLQKEVYALLATQGQIPQSQS